MKKSNLLIIIIAIPLCILAFVALPWILIYFGILFSPNPPEPEITYAEFPLELVYTIDEKTFTINDSYICEYDGIGMYEGVGKYIKWKKYFKNSKLEELILYEKGEQKIVCDIGSPEYYMDDPDYYNTYAVQENLPRLFLIETFENITKSHYLDDEEMANYRIEIISWKLSPPISNTYK